MQMSKMMKSAAIAIGAALALPALAADPLPGIYVGADYLHGTFEVDGVDGDANPSALYLRGGYQFNPYFAAEARVGTGLDSDKFHGVKTEIENFVGLYAKLGVPTGIGLYPYVIAGVTDGEVKLSARGWSDKADDNDISLGVGVQYLVDRNWAVGIEYMKYMDTDDFEISGVSLGATYRF